MEEKIVIDTKKWEAHEYEHKPKSIDWIWAVGLIALAISIVAFWKHNPLFGIFILLSATILIIFTIRHPEKITFEINSDELKMGNKSYPIEKIKGFIIRDGGEENKLIVEINKYFMPIYTIPLPKEISKEVETELEKIVPKKEIQEPQTIQFMERIGF